MAIAIIYNNNNYISIYCYNSIYIIALNTNITSSEKVLTLSHSNFHNYTANRFFLRLVTIRFSVIVSFRVSVKLTIIMMTLSLKISITEK